MSLLPTPERLALLPRCRTLCDELLSFTDVSKHNYEFVSKAVKALYVGCEALANLESSENHTDGIGTCPVCGNTNLAHGYPGRPPYNYCVPCMKPFLLARGQLGSLQGMGFSAI